MGAAKKAQPKKGKAAPADASGQDQQHEKKGGKERGKKAKKEWHFAADDLETQLSALGLRVKTVAADGNCFFRSLGDQLKGDERMHVELRAKVVAYMRDHEEDFAPFVEDDESFGTYIARMKKDGVWAGYMEVIATSHALGANLTIYQAGQPRWLVSTQPQDAPMLHLSYHDGQHYNSVRMADDYEHGPPKPIVISVNLDAVAAAQAAGAGNGSGDLWGPKEEARVAASMAVRDVGLVRKALKEARGNVDAAIEWLVEYLAEHDEGHEEEKEEQQQQGGDGTSGLPDGQVPEPAPAPAPAAGLHEDPGQAQVHSARKTRDGGEASSSDQQAGQSQQPAEGIAEAVVGPDAASVVHQAGSPQQAGGNPEKGHRSGSDSEEDSHTDSKPVKDKTDTATATGAPTAKQKGVRVGGKSGKGKEGSASGTARKPARNKECPCGSRKKYKNCCGAAAAAAERRRAAAGEATEGSGSKLGPQVGAADAAAVAAAAAQLAAIAI